MAIFLSCAPSPAYHSIESVEGPVRLVFWFDHERESPRKWTIEYYRLQDVLKALMNREMLETVVRTSMEDADWELFIHPHDDHVNIGCKHTSVRGDTVEMVSLTMMELDRTTARVMEILERHGYDHTLIF